MKPFVALLIIAPLLVCVAALVGLGGVIWSKGLHQGPIVAFVIFGSLAAILGRILARFARNPEWELPVSEEVDADANLVKVLTRCFVLCAVWEPILGIVLWHGGYKADRVWSVMVPLLFGFNTLILLNLPIAIRRHRSRDNAGNG